MNQDDSTYEIPHYILSRLQPTLPLGFPLETRRNGYLEISFAICRAGYARTYRRFSSAGPPISNLIFRLVMELTCFALHSSDFLKTQRIPCQKTKHGTSSLNVAWVRMLSTWRPCRNENNAHSAVQMSHLGWAISSSIRMIQCIQILMTKKTTIFNDLKNTPNRTEKRLPHHPKGPAFQELR